MVISSPMWIRSVSLNFLLKHPVEPFWVFAYCPQEPIFMIVQSKISQIYQTLGMLVNPHSVFPVLYFRGRVLL